MQKQKILFIDRDGTLIVEPKENFQIDSYEKLEFIPAVIRNLYKIVTELDYLLVMVTNQDGLGTNSFPEDDFWPVHNKMLKILENEGIKFHKIHIDRSFEEDNLPTRKPGTEMLTEYLKGDYDLKNSFVIGDRITDMRLAKNLGTGAFLLPSDDDLALIEKYGLKETCLLSQTNWDEIYAFLRKTERTAEVHRKTKETDVFVALDLDGRGKAEISTGLHFFDHMLEQIARHASIDLTIKVQGDLHVDEHHTIEDTAITLGEAVNKALGSKAGIERYGFCLPMDDCLAQVAIDFGGRNWIEWEADFKREKIGDMPTEMFFHFFKSFSDSAKCNLNIKAEGDNEHHKIEAIFKALAKAIKMAKTKTAGNDQLPSTKGIL